MDIQDTGQREALCPAEECAQVEMTSIDLQQLFECLNLLPERYQLPLQLHLQEKWSSQRIAAYLNKPQGTIESLLWRGKRRLEKLGVLKERCHISVRKKIIGTEIVEHIRHLPRPYRGLLHSHYVNRQTYTEMAQASGIPIGTLKSRVHRGNKLLFDSFSREESEGS